VSSYVYDRNLGPAPMISGVDLVLDRIRDDEAFTIRFDVNGNRLAVANGVDAEREVEVFERITGSGGVVTWERIAKTDLNETIFQDYTPRERGSEVYYSVAINEDQVALGIPEDSRFGYRRTDTLDRQGAGIVVNLALTQIFPAGELPYELVGSAVSPFAVSDLQPGDRFGWRLTDVVNGKYLVSRPNSALASQAPDTGDILLFEMP